VETLLLLLPVLLTGFHLFFHAKDRFHLPIDPFVAIVAAYALVVFGPWYFARYFYPLIIPVTLVLAVAADELLAVAGARRAVALAAIAALGVAGSVADPRWRALFEPRPPQWGYMRIGEWARDHIPPGTRIGGAQSGALGYFADRLTVVNLDGVVNRACYDAMRAGRMLPYIRGAGVRLLVWQDDIEAIARETRDGDAGALTHLGQVPGIETGGWSWQLYRVEPASPVIPAPPGAPRSPP